MMFMARQVENDGRIEDPSIVDNEWLDEVTLHFGEWFKQLVDWTDQNLQWFLKIIEWPFRFLFELFMNEDPGRTSIMDIPWYWVAIGFFLIGSIARNTRIGLMVAAMVAVCGLLGPDYWSVTAKTFGMIGVSVFLCALVGIPLGILCGRVDAVWNAVRPTLDAMQVVHSFVYMLPFLFFWGVGEVSATMVTMVFALPPLVRLTNLGIRQVPEDVVEASRSYGASEVRVLTDVQLPLARPAIMTGLNQTLLLAISMLGIAALMGAENLGTLLLRAITTQNLPLAASGGFAFFLVAVVLDRISQREVDDGRNLLSRIREALAMRRDPHQLEGLVADEAVQRAAVEAAAAAEPDERPAPVNSRERLGLLLSAGGSIAAIISVFLPWGADAGLVSAWGRRADETELIGQTFLGIEASGGSVFAVIVLLLGLLGALAALRPLVRPSSGSLSTRINATQGMLFAGLAGIGLVIWLLNWLDIGYGPLPSIALAIFGIAALLVLVDTWIAGTPRLGADGATIAALGGFGATLGYLYLRTSPLTEQYSHQFGAYVALAATAVAALGGLIALSAAPYTPLRPLSLSISWGRIIGAVFAGLLLFVGCYAVWFVDERLDSLITPEIEARIAQLEEEAGDDINKQIANSQEITNIINSAKAGQAPQYFGINDQHELVETPIINAEGETVRVARNARSTSGPRLGWPTLALGAIAAAAAAVSAGLAGSRADGLVWRSGTLAAGFGLGASAIPMAWILSFTRSADAPAITGAGVAFAAIAAFILFALGQGAIKEFRRRKIYADLTSASEAAPATVLDATASEASDALVGVGAEVS